MAVTDDQMDQLKRFAYDLGRDGILGDPTDTDIIDAVFDLAATHQMRTEDEFDAILTPEDLPAQEDNEDLVNAWKNGTDVYNEKGARDV